MADLVFTRLPVPAGTSISGTFGQTEGYPHPHRGVDYECSTGTPIVAPAEGVVVDFFNDGSFGTAICLDHRDTPWFSLYAHLSDARVRVGDTVRAGDLLGLSGATGMVTGPHLHWQVCRQSSFPADIAQSADPLSFLHPGPVPEPAARHEEPPAGQMVRVVVEAGDCVHVRKEPSTAAASLGCFSNGTVLAVRGPSREAGGRTWRPVVTPGGDDGWAAADFLE